MSEKTDISYVDSSVNPTSGCDGCELFKASDPAKATCYAKWIHEGTLARSMPKLYAPSFSEVRLIPGRMAKAAAWPDLRGKSRVGKPWLNGQPRFVFVGDMADIFSKGVPFEYLSDEVFAPMSGEAGRRHFWIVLTKRPQRMAEFSKTIEWPGNCVAMTSVTSQRTVEARMPHLMEVKARLLGVSAEPLFEFVDLSKWLPRLAWLIPGGMSGENRVDCGTLAIAKVAMAGFSAGVPTFVKQDSALKPGQIGRLSGDIWSLKQVPDTGPRGGELPLAIETEAAPVAGVELELPHWPGGPEICAATNLLAFKDWKEAMKFNESNGGNTIAEKWKCRVCGRWHYISKPRGPSGETSGNARSYAVSERMLSLKRRTEVVNI